MFDISAPMLTEAALDNRGHAMSLVTRTSCRLMMKHFDAVCRLGTLYIMPDTVSGSARDGASTPAWREIGRAHV